jgi:gluconokinase
MNSPQAIICMGVSGSGKTTIGKQSAERLGWIFLDADDFHPAANIEKMKHGIPLNDDDRKPWLQRLHLELQERLANGQSVILACSALKESYRSTLRDHLPQIRFVYLDIDAETIRSRLEHRAGHFFPKELLESQLATLEKPKDAIVVDARQSENEIVDEVVRKITEDRTLNTDRTTGI